MRKRVYIAVAALLVAIVGVVGTWGAARKEPTWQGRPLHDWIERIDKVTFRITATQGIRLSTTNSAVQAVLATEGNAIPWLRRELRATDSGFNRKLRLLAIRIPTWLGRWRLVHFLTPNPPLDLRHERAAMAALILGERAKALAPELGALLTSGDGCSVYAYSLARMGTDAIPFLVQGLTNTSTQMIAMNALECTDARIDNAVPALLSILTNGGGFPTIPELFLKAKGASNAILPVARAGADSTNWIVRENCNAILGLMKTERKARTGEGRLEVEKYCGSNLSWRPTSQVE